MIQTTDHLKEQLISVIIPCYNHGKYLVTAIESVLSQTYKNHEIIVVDDGSIDNTKDVVLNYKGVHYIYQQNQGLSSARNIGIKKSLGMFLTFLDADDWLVPDALNHNLCYFEQNPTVAFIAGSHEVFYESENKKWIIRNDLPEVPYLHLLERNYIGMHATVLFQRWVFDFYKYDTSLKSCEDYDLYLKITREYPIFIHQHLIAVYRIHGNNMSSKYATMLESALLVLSRQKEFLTTQKELEWYQKGLLFWKAYYSEKMYKQMIFTSYQDKKVSKHDITVLKNYNYTLFEKFNQEKKSKSVLFVIKKIKVFIKKILLYQLLKKWNKYFFHKSSKINFGDLNHTSPLSTQFGYDRGGPIDRYYIEKFLEQHTSIIKGNVLEIGDNEYTLQYGKDKLTKSDILHVDQNNAKATFIGDLSEAPHIPDNSFDCIILTQTLHLIYNYKGAIETCYRTLKPGGTLLLTVPGISHIAQDQWGKYWLWSFTDTSIKKILNEFFLPDNIKVDTYGNVLVATAFLYGIGLPEISKEQVDSHDPHYQVIITATAVK